LVILGDIAYNLDTDNGVKYEQFLKLLAQNNVEILIFSCIVYLRLLLTNNSNENSFQYSSHCDSW